MNFCMHFVYNFNEKKDWFDEIILLNRCTILIHTLIFDIIIESVKISIMDRFWYIIGKLFLSRSLHLAWWSFFGNTDNDREDPGGTS